MKQGACSDCCEGHADKMTLHHNSARCDVLLHCDEINDHHPARVCKEEIVVVCDARQQTEIKENHVGLGSLQQKQVHNQHNADDRSYTERRNRTHATRSSCVPVKLCVFILCILMPPSLAQPTTDCDFKGSGLDLEDSGVQPVYLSCSSGRIEWRHPRAALRILLRYPDGKRDFRGCIRASPSIEGARLFVEGHRSLVPLFAADDGQPHDRIRCFTSYKGQAALYLEAEPSTGFKDLRADFEYDLRSISSEHIYDPMEECRPCSNAELVQLYCSADFAAKASIVAVEDDHRLLHTKLTLAASRVFQQTMPVFSKGIKEKGEGRSRNSLLLPLRKTLADKDSEEIPSFLGHLYVPLECDARSGPGEFMVLGTMRLGLPILRCAPRIEDWKNIVRTAQDRAHCVLEV